ncbi:MAG: ABC transporter ATP-binding protein, partial [Planctomycetes bacterium]|nr:ABC transporter ATP-binding protein [Planctomycetota bacterium]
MIEVVGLHKSYRIGGREIQALRGVDLALPERSFSFILGPSGSGKSTLLHCLGALDVPTRGEVRIDGQSLADLSERERSLFRRRRVGFVFQSFNLISNLTAVENVLLPVLPDGVNGAHRKQAEEVLARVGLGDRLEHRPVQLSGGEQQRVAIARALCKSPRVILADEPTGDLDSATGTEVMGYLRELNRSAGTTLVVVTHDTTHVAE